MRHSVGVLSRSLSAIKRVVRHLSPPQLQQQSFNSSTIVHLYFQRLPRLWNALPPVDQEKGTTSLQWTKTMERPPASAPRLWNAPLQWTKIMEHPPLRGPRLYNKLPPVCQDYGTPSQKWAKIMECPPSSGPRLWNALPRLPF